MIQCDICKKEVDSGHKLVPLLNIYRTNDIKEVCWDCEKEVNSHLAKLKTLSAKFTQNALKEFMGNIRKRFSITKKEEVK